MSATATYTLSAPTQQRSSQRQASRYDSLFDETGLADRIQPPVQRCIFLYMPYCVAACQSPEVATSCTAVSSACCHETEQDSTIRYVRSVVQDIIPDSAGKVGGVIRDILPVPGFLKK